MFRTSFQRRTAAAVAGVVGLIASLLVITGAEAGAGTASVVDYAQCANQSPTGPDATTSDDCQPQGWINGILQASNSHYKEDQVTPQRLEVYAQPKVGHTITLRYMARKGNIHAYDYLDTWNATSTGADRCQGLTASAKVGLSCGVDVPTSTFPIAIDSTAVRDDLGAGNDHKTDAHGVVPGQLQMYGGVITGMTTPIHDNANGTGDDYATTTITYTTTAPARNVQLLFGGHLASPLDWQAGHGASSISGGPYHIKWDGADGGSVGNRDNQIMGSAIVPLANTTIPTAATATAIVGGTIQDKAWLPGVTSDATGTITFTAYPTLAACQAQTGGTSAGSKNLTTVSVVDVLGTSTNFLGATSDAISVGVGSWYWQAVYSGDAKNNGATGTCGDTDETSVVGRATPSYSTTAASSPTTLTVGTAATLSDTATFSGGYNVGGSVTWHLFFDSTSSSVCTNEITLSSPTSQVTSGTASITGITVTPTSPGTYYFTSSYSGDTNNNGDTTTGYCGATGESVTVGRAANTGTTVQKLADTVTVTGYNPTGNVTFKLYGPYAGGATIDCAVAKEVFSSTVALASGSASTTDNADAALRYYSAAAAGTYAWAVTYAGDANNAGGPVSACGAERANVTYPA